MIDAIDGELGDVQAAPQGIGRALEIEPNLTRAHLSMGRVQRARGELEAALGSLRRPWNLILVMPSY